MKVPVGNPYLPNFEYVPDAEPYVFGDRLYVFGSHDRFGWDDFCVGDYQGWSAPLDSLSDWHHEGTIYRRDQDPLYEKNIEACRMFAPDVEVGADGKYYLYYGLSHTGEIHVAVCDTPAGRYEYLGPVIHPDGTALGKKDGDPFQYDPGVLRDDDGRIYLYSGFCFDSSKIVKFKGLPENRQGAFVYELSQDMRTVITEPKYIVPCWCNSAGTGFEGHAFFEASSIRKIGNTYYFIYSSEQGHELCYATSSSPVSGFQFRGTIVSNGDIGYGGRTDRVNYTGTNHGSIVHLPDGWYVFYHRQSGGSPYARQGCAEKIEILPDGSIPQVRVTSTGLGGCPFPGKGTYGVFRLCCLKSASGACEYAAKTRVDDTHPYLTQDGPDREDTPGQYLHNLKNGASVGFRSFHMDHICTIAITCRGNAEGTLELCSGEQGPVIGAASILPETAWHSVTCEISPQKGEADLWMVYRGSGSLDLKDFTLD